jgi:hypothetical protein
MSSFKQLNKADITTVPYAANKRWNFSYISVPNDDYVVFSRGKNELFSITGSTTVNGQYQSLIYDSINHMFYQSYSGSLLDTGSLMFNINTYESASQQRPTASYFKYNINPSFVNNFPTASNSTINVLSVNQSAFGSKILPNSFKITSSIGLVTDDGYGNLYSGSEHIGNIFYAQGLAIITNQSSSYQNLLTGSFASTASISFQNEHIIYENEIRCIVRESDFNLSYNPSLLKYGTTLTTASIDPNSIIVSSSLSIVNILGVDFIRIDYNFTNPTANNITLNYTLNYTDNAPTNISTPYTAIIPPGKTYTPSPFGGTTLDSSGASYNIVLDSATYNQYELIDSTIKDFATGSAFQPYTTTIGLYNDDNELLMVAKLGKPIALSSDTDMTFIVRYDT